MFQGHAADGSSIQKHSCGSHYPFVFVVHEVERTGCGYAEVRDPAGRIRYSTAWRLEGPNVKEQRLLAYERALERADVLAQAHRMGSESLQ